MLSYLFLTRTKQERRTRYAMWDGHVPANCFLVRFHLDMHAGRFGGRGPGGGAAGGRGAGGGAAGGLGGRIVRRKLRFSYHPTFIVYALRKKNTFTPADLGLIRSRYGLGLHGAFGSTYPPIEQTEFPLFEIADDVLEILETLSPEYHTDEKFTVSTDTVSVRVRAMGVMWKHLRYFPLLTEVHYWPACIRLYYDLGMDGLLAHIRAAHLALAQPPVMPNVPVPNVPVPHAQPPQLILNAPDGWWGIRGMELLQHTDTYPPIVQLNATLKYGVFEAGGLWFMHEPSVAVTEIGDVLPQPHHDRFIIEGVPAPHFNEILLFQLPIH